MPNRLPLVHSAQGSAQRIKREVEAQDVHMRFAKHAKLAPPGVARDHFRQARRGQAARSRNTLDLPRRVLRADMQIEAGA